MPKKRIKKVIDMTFIFIFLVILAFILFLFLNLTLLGFNWWKLIYSVPILIILFYIEFELFYTIILLTRKLEYRNLSNSLRKHEKILKEYLASLKN